MLCNLKLHIHDRSRGEIFIRISATHQEKGILWLRWTVSYQSADGAARCRPHQKIAAKKATKAQGVPLPVAPPKIGYAFPPKNALAMIRRALQCLIIARTRPY